MLTIAILDDDAQSASTLRTLVSRHMPQGAQHVIHESTSVSELQELLAAGVEVDILICDVLMGEGEPTGIEVAQRLFPPESGTQVIFVSGYLEQATEVYAAEHVYFLLKPVDEAKLKEALRKALEALARRYPAMLRIKEGHKERLINAAAIVYLESNLHKVSVHCRTHTFETYAKLDELAKQLPTGFTRCHRSFLVNLAQVRSLGADALILHDGTSVPVSRRRAKQVQHDLLGYLASKG